MYVYLPKELHAKITKITSHGERNKLIVECLEEAMESRWKKFVKQITEQLGSSTAKGKNAG